MKLQKKTIWVLKISSKKPLFHVEIRRKNMSLDNEPMKVSVALRIAKQYYPQDKLEHALRVATYVAENEMIPSEYTDECVALAIMHDLLEDTNYNPKGLPENFTNALKILTKAKEAVSYTHLNIDCDASAIILGKDDKYRTCVYYGDRSAEDRCCLLYTSRCV